MWRFDPLLAKPASDLDAASIGILTEICLDAQCIRYSDRYLNPANKNDLELVLQHL